MRDMREVVLMWMTDAAKEMRLRARKAREAYPEKRWGVPAADAYDEAAVVFTRHARAYQAEIDARAALPSPDGSPP